MREGISQISPAVHPSIWDSLGNNSAYGCSPQFCSTPEENRTAIHLESDRVSYSGRGLKTAPRSLPTRSFCILSTSRTP